MFFVHNMSAVSGFKHSKMAFHTACGWALISAAPPNSYLLLMESGELQCP